MLDFDVWSIIWSIANILILYILLRIFLFKPVNKIMDERTKTIQNDLDTAKKSREEAEALRQQYADDISSARGSGYHHEGSRRCRGGKTGYHRTL